MKIGDKVTMNDYSSYKGLSGVIMNISSNKSDLIIELENGLVIKAPIEVVL